MTKDSFNVSAGKHECVGWQFIDGLEKWLSLVLSSCSPVELKKNRCCRFCELVKYCNYHKTSSVRIPLVVNI